MDLKQHVIIINGENKTYQIESIKLDGHKYVIKFHNSAKTYTYNQENVIWMSEPVILDTDNIHVFVKGTHIRKNMESVRLFSTSKTRYFSEIKIKYYALVFENGFISQHPENEVQIRKTCLSGKSVSVFNYLKQCAGINTIGISDEEVSQSDGILSAIYSQIDFIDDETVASVYLNPDKGFGRNRTTTPIFPFGCNASQERAVKKALANQISVIQGPPGTGKTQTILNIIANLIVAKKSVLVVSNNNSATENILEKLTKNGFGFLVAPLGKKENKEAFIANQPRLNPELTSWYKSSIELEHAFAETLKCIQLLESIFEMQERLALCKQELAEIKVERLHFIQDNSIEPTIDDISINSDRILKILNTLEDLAIKLSKCDTKIWAKIKFAISKFFLKLRLRSILKTKTVLTTYSIPQTITLLEFLFYERKISELNVEIQSFETKLAQLDADSLMKSLTTNSMTILKAKLSERYKSERQIIASVADLFHDGRSILKDYPIVLSTTFSSRLCIDKDTLFDYVIMDEASQVAIDTGFLAFT